MIYIDRQTHFSYGVSQNNNRKIGHILDFLTRIGESETI